MISPEVLFCQSVAEGSVSDEAVLSVVKGERYSIVSILSLAKVRFITDVRETKHFQMQRS